MTHCNGKRRYLLRESYAEAGRMRFRDLFDLGENPAAYIVYPGGNSFYFHELLTEALFVQGVTGVDRKLEKILLPFLQPDIRRIVTQMTRLSRRRRVAFNGRAMAQAQAGLHLFDRRRFWLLRFGRMDRTEVLMRSHRFLNALLDKSRDEIEYYFQDMEARLRTREKKGYVYQSLDLARRFPGETARLFPLGLDQDQLDQAFIEDICRLAGDPDFIDFPEPGGPLSPYLVRYVVMWFDYEFGERPPQARIMEEFVRGRRAFRPPPPPIGPDLAGACRVFAISIQEWRDLNRNQIGALYRRLALTRHPDQGGDPETFMELNSAYERLIQDK